jgi:hypothetical protein
MDDTAMSLAQPTCPVVERRNRHKTGAHRRCDRFTLTILIVAFQIDGPARPLRRCQNRDERECSRERVSAALERTFRERSLW